MLPPATSLICDKCDHMHRRTGRGGGQGAAAPQFGQFVDIHSDRESTLFGQNTIHVTAVNGKNYVPPNRARKISATTPPPTEYGSRAIPATTPPPHRIDSGKTRSAPPPQWMLARTPIMSCIIRTFFIVQILQSCTNGCRPTALYKHSRTCIQTRTHAYHFRGSISSIELMFLYVY